LQLAEACPLGVHRSFPRRRQRPQRLAFAARARRCRSLLREHAARCADRVERVGFAARATLPPQPTDLVYPLTAGGQVAGQAGAERAAALNRERTTTCRVLIDELQGICVTVAVRGDVRLEHHGSADDMHQRKRMRITMRINTDHVVQLICKHP